MLPNAFCAFVGRRRTSLVHPESEALEPNSREEASLIPPILELVSLTLTPITTGYFC
jgi:hypothetical protein